MDVLSIFRRKESVAKNEQGVICNKSPTECELGNKAIMMYGGVWFGGECSECGEFKQGDFIGNDVMGTIDEDGNKTVRPMDESLVEVIESGVVEIRPLTHRVDSE